MEIAGSLFSNTVLGVFALSLLPVYYKAWRWADRARLEREHLFAAYFGSLVFLLMLWTLRTDVMPGLQWHVSGMVMLTLMWGWSLALIGGALVVVGISLAGMNDWSGILPTLWLQVVIPASLTQLVLGLVRAHLPKNYFVFVFINAFLCAGLMAVVLAILAAAVLALTGAYTWAQLQSDWLLLLPLMIFPEGFFNGMVISVLVALRPAWVWSFRDDEYLKGK